MMKNYLLNADKKVLRLIRTIGQHADRREVCAYVVGGTVRDMILNKKNCDIDICVEGDALGLAKALAKTWRAPLTIYKEFQTASLQLPGDVRVDLAQTRKERYVRPGALPTVEPGTLVEDLFRRDFTINAMAIAVNAECSGELIDEFGGFQDCLQRKIRILHDQSFIDDPTRILRAVRFEQRFQFTLEAKTLKLMKLALNKKAENKVKPPRYFVEFKKILNETDPVKPVRQLQALKGLRFLGLKSKIPISPLSKLHLQIKRMKYKPLYKDFESWWLIYWLKLMSYPSDQTVKNILKKFHFKKEERSAIVQSRRANTLLKKLSAKHVRASEVYQLLKPFHKETIIFLRVRTSQLFVKQRIERYLKEYCHVQLNISGSDLKKLGVAEGRTIGKILNAVLYLKIDKKISTRQQEMNRARISIGKY